MKKAIKTLTNKKRKLRSGVKSDYNFSDAETTQYTEPYKDTSKKDELYRRKAKKKAIKIFTTSKKKVREIISSDENFSELKLSNTLTLIETPVKKRRYTEETLRKRL